MLFKVQCVALKPHTSCRTILITHAEFKDDIIQTFIKSL